MRIFIGLLLTGMVLIAGPVAAAQANQRKTETEATVFVAAIRSGNMSALRAYFPKDYPASELSPGAPDMVFAKNTMLPIILKDAIGAKEVARKGHLFSILFYQAHFKDSLDNKTYLEKDYLKSFFVCNFDDSGGHWILSDPIMCFDETEGPYERVGY